MNFRYRTSGVMNVNRLHGYKAWLQAARTEGAPITLHAVFSPEEIPVFPHPYLTSKRNDSDAPHKCVGEKLDEQKVLVP